MRLKGGRNPYIPQRRALCEDRYDQLIDEVIGDALQATMRQTRDFVRDLRQGMDDSEEPCLSVTRDPAGRVEIATVSRNPMTARYGKVGGIEFSANSSDSFRAMVPQFRAKNS